MPLTLSEVLGDRLLWTRYSEVIRHFLERQSLYEDLSREAAFTLEKRLSQHGIEFASVTFRAKSLHSLLRKLERKRYEDALAEITDLAGVRVVHLYASDFEKIRRVIEHDFLVEETIDKLAEFDVDRFGYGAVHFICKLGEGFLGARYEDLQELTFELQSRTILQDAWATISHHLVYKRKQDAPPRLRRRLNSLAAMFETADTNFDQLRAKRANYLRDLLQRDITHDGIEALLREVLPDLYSERSPGHIQVVMQDLDRDRYRILRDIGSLLDRTELARSRFFDQDPIGRSFAASVLAVALGLDDPSYRKAGWDADDLKRFEGLAKLVEPLS